MNFIPQDKLDIIIYLIIFLILINLFSLFSTYFRARSTGVNSFETVNYYLAKGNFKAAIAICNKLNKKRPHDPNVLLMTAITLFKAGKKQESKKLFEKLVLKDPQFTTEANKYLETLKKKT